MAELLGASARRGVAGGCGFHVGTSAAASAMVRRGEGERQGACEVSTGSGRRRGGILRRRASAGEGRQAGRWRGELGGVAVSLFCLLAEVGDDWNKPDGPGQPGKWPLAFLSLSFLNFCFLIFCNCWALLKILKRFQKS